MRKKLGIIFMILGVLLIFSAGALLSYNRMTDQEANEAAQEVLPDMKEAIAEQGEAEPVISDEMKTVEIDGYEYIGYLSIPVLELELPVMAQWDYTRLKLAPCLYFGSVKTNDMVIAAHNYSRHFGRLKQLKTGDPVCFTDAEGNIYTYEVGGIETLPPDAVEEMIESEWELTLYTCTYGGAERVTVRCGRVE